LKPAHQRDGVLTAIKLVLEIVVVAIFVITFLVQPFRIPSESMEPTLLVGDFLLADKQSFAPQGMLDKVLPPARIERGDIVVFHDPVRHEPSEPGGPDLDQPAGDSVHLVKRVIGVPGDRVRLHDGRVLLNGIARPEPYAFYAPSRPNNFRDDFPSLREADPNVEPRWWIELRRSTVRGELVVPPNRYFVMGDNRNDSADSRYWGFVPREAIIGRPLVVYFSLRQPNESSDQATLWQRVRERLYVVRTSLRVLH
jgi:signal peptidase I